MANRFLNNITINDQYTFPSSDGADGQILSTTGAADGTTELQFIDQGNIVAGEADKANSVILRVKNSTASAMSKGQVVCEAVTATPPNGNLIEVALADNNGTNTMPALGILNEDLDAAGGANDEGDAIMFGKVSGIDTSAFSVGDEVFVDDTPGGLTTTKPTGVKYIQKVGVVIRDDNTNGTIEVFGAGRVNDVPTPLYVDHANQRLGIGAINPSEKLEVQGSVNNDDVAIRIENTYDDNLSSSRPAAALTFETASNNGHLRVYGAPADTAANHQIDLGSTAASSYLTFSPNGSEKMRVTSGGNVGIGAPNPSGKLEVRQSANNGNTGAFTNTHVKLTASATADNTGFVGITAATSTADNYGYSFGAQRTSGGVGDFKINYHNNSAAGLNRFIIDQNGNVGIGTTSPSTKLHTDFGTLANGGVNELVVQSKADGSTYYSNSAITGITFTNWINGYTAGSLNRAAGIYGYNADTAERFGRFMGLSFYTSSLDATATEKMRIDHLGNVGIGYTDPQEKLHVYNGSVYITPIAYAANQNDWVIRAGAYNNTAFDQGLKLKSSSGGVSYMAFETAHSGGETMVLRSGRVGIGTDSPLEKLSVAPDTDVSAEIGKAHIGQVGFNGYAGFSHVDQNSQQGYALIQHSDGSTYMNANTGKNIKFRIANSDKMILDSSGNVGIGTTGPQSKLHVSGSGSETTLMVGASGTLSDKSARIFLNEGESGVTNSKDYGFSLAYDGNSSAQYGLSSNQFGIIRHNNSATGEAVMRINRSSNNVIFSGNVGVGMTTDPQVKLHVANGTLRAWPPTSGTTAIFESTANNRSFVTITAANEAELWFGNAATQTLGRIRYEMAGNNMEFWTSQTQKMVINSGGNVGINITNPSQKLHVSGSALVSSNLYIYSTSYYLNVYFGRIDLNAANGISVRSGTTYKPVYASAFNVVSDYRLKSNIVPLENAISRVNQLEVHRFNWNDRLNEPKVDGFIAHEVAAVIPEAVLGEKDAVHEDGTPNHQGIDQAKIVPLLTAALQEAIAKIESLEARIQTLENQ